MPVAGIYSVARNEKSCTIKNQSTDTAANESFSLSLSTYHPVVGIQRGTRIATHEQATYEYSFHKHSCERKQSCERAYASTSKQRISQHRGHDAHGRHPLRRAEREQLCTKRLVLL